MNHPAGKYIAIPDDAPADAIPLMKRYNQLMWDMKEHKSVDDMLNDYQHYRNEKLYYMADYIRDVFEEIGYKLIIDKQGGVRLEKSSSQIPQNTYDKS